jgi:hypothetical protein
VYTVVDCGSGETPEYTNVLVVVPPYENESPFASGRELTTTGDVLGTGVLPPPGDEPPPPHPTKTAVPSKPNETANIRKGGRMFASVALLREHFLHSFGT